MPLSLSDPHWYPIASSDDLPFRHVYQGQLLGRELAVWRADDGHVNVWENRCLHRGVRLSIGINEGQELKCQYHGWRYANQSAGCTYIPAHPADAPARRIENRKYPMREAFGLIWSAANDDQAFVPFPGAGDHDWFALRPVPVNAAPEDVVAGLARLAPDDQPADLLPGMAVRLDGVVYFVQPVDAGRAVIRGLLPQASGDPITILRHYNELLTRLRDRLERAAARKPAPEPLQPAYEKVSADLATMPEIAIPRGNTLPVLVRRKWQTADGVIGFELAGRDGKHLPTFQPGAHIDLHLPNGLIRQYSITNGPGDLLSYVIGVKAESASKGGSKVLVETVREGDVLAISEPRNNFPLRRDATRTVLIAGGIGITPLLSMARFLDQSSLPYELHYFTRSGESAAFKSELDVLHGAVHIHSGLAREAIQGTVNEVLGPHDFANHVYVCGPGAMLEMVTRTAAALGWPDEAVHFEYFQNDKVIDSSSAFDVELARSAMTLHVPAGRTILEVMREAGLTVPSSCEQGACGTCLTTVMEGEVDHQDVYLNKTEKASNTCMMTCVSRAKSARLVLDI
ncbi:Rieske 2Fe-2S domain-containing protein [Devosia sp. XJ19-1]|uniref:Rieske 2Fe-2S domain-containing protein n=1 Tax=Devosia ureilytica TaxID=2952754 RepID=A0A9Q4FTC5_9HYPH|nr:Rieske 2Fe-2S domain-containing protein [Devosia ureilytica]MCP8884071.1 Rieske 2Fe-2S domain-containing protein [Devosia ureilytica]MCP8887679.1 Rieske 2Fe-2S domain-containing protein [Devosia ureilytica]